VVQTDGEQGVLFANAALTLTLHLGKDAARARDGHLAMWRPFMRRLHERLAAREGKPPVYLLLGHFARDELADHIGESRMLATLRRDGRLVERPHPRRAAFMGSNALDEVNSKLANPSIIW
jgi:uracil-DNA glycosylase